MINFGQFMEIVIATHNNDKLKELLKAFSHHFKDIKLLTLNDFPDIGEIIEDGKTLEQNALIKAKEVFNITGIPTLSDDTGLEVDALDGAPGIYTARYAGENCSYYDNVKKLLDDMQTIPIPNRVAKFKTVIAYIDEGLQMTAEGIADGSISRSSIGDFGFGYDPIFFIPEVNKTFAEMKIDEKEIYSHRGKAIRSIMDTLIPHLEKLSKTTKKEIA
jgi:XTP/dITP diphosphohydrolase